MQNTATWRLSKAWNDAGVSSLRFNFRGVGESTGASGNGDGVPELEDAHVALEWLAAQGPSLPLFTSGFSFGSRTALTLAISRREVRGVLALGFPAALFDGSFLSSLTSPAVFVHADQDEFGTLDEVRTLLARVPARPPLLVLENSDHLATGRLGALTARLNEALALLLQSSLPEGGPHGLPVHD